VEEEHIRCEGTLLLSHRVNETGLYPGATRRVNSARKSNRGKRRIAILGAAVASSAVLIIALGISTVTSSESLKRATTSDAAGWVLETVDNSANSGWFTSIDVDTSNHAHIAYCNYPVPTGNPYLMYATNSAGSWAYETLNSDGSVGLYTSIALDSSDQVHISYHNSTDSDLNYATNAGGSWDNYTLDRLGSVGTHSSIAVDSDDNVHISYYDGSTMSLNYATNASGSWVIYDQLDGSFGIDRGKYTSIALDVDDNVHISYYSVIASALMYATNSGGSWEKYHLDMYGDVGLYTSIAVDTNGYAHISYYNYSAYDLKYATNLGGSWAIYTVDGGGGANSGMYSSIALDADDNVHISYHNATSGDLMYATNAGGPWAINAIATTGWVGTHTSIAVDSVGSVHISYFDSTNSALKYATNSVVIPEFGTVGLVIVVMATISILAARSRASTTRGGE